MNDERVTWTPQEREVGDPPRPSLTLAFIKLLVGALAARSMEWVALGGAIGMWGYSSFHADLYKIGAAVGYTLLVYVPLLWHRKV